MRIMCRGTALLGGLRTACQRQRRLSCVRKINIYRINWLEYWRLSDLGMALDRIRGEFDLRVSESGRFAVLNVSEVKAAVEKVTQRRPSITHQPTATMDSHAAVFGFFASDFEVAAELAEIVAAENVFPAVSDND